MTEGGNQENMSTDVLRSQSLDALDLKCPICLEQLQHPKSLPCLHSFCQECLGSYITKELSGKMAPSSSFSCPVCRKITEPVHQADDKERWAEEFPTNKMAVEMIRHLQNADSLIMTCTPCKKKGNINIVAKFWCDQNKSYFCENCKTNLHDLVHGNCEPENIMEWNKSSAIRRKMSATECEEHKEKIEYFCEAHQMLGCNKCVIVNHRTCEVVTSVDDFRAKLSNGGIERLPEELQRCVEVLEELIKDVAEQLHTLTEDQVIALQSLTDLRSKINEKLDTLQKELIEKLTASFVEEKETFDITRKKCERLMFAMQKTLTSSQDIALVGDTLGTIRVFQRGQAEVESCKELIRELEESSRSITLKHKYNSDIVDKKISRSLGKIAVRKQERGLPIRWDSIPLFKRKLRMVRKFSIKLTSDKDNCGAYGIVLLSGGRIVVGDSCNKKVKLFTDNGDFHFELGLRSESCDLCRIDDTSVAVMLVSAKTICIVTVQNFELSILSHIKIQNIAPDFPYGVAFVNNSFVISTTSITTSLHAVPRYGRKGSKATKLHQMESKCLHLANDHLNEHVFASIYAAKSEDDMAVIRLSNGMHTDVLKFGVVEGTTGLDVDREGNVYVCGSRSHNIIQMSGDGTNVRELLTSADGIESPRAISLLNDKVVITNDSSNRANIVHVFQLV
ncbi:tripartite motif-containing protein 2-like [Argopecten irradians]|uniref:tripartite motif-containing protein 2-like n=1 Tax=Argopecten irradians TaxID=31199 RepID=UPI00372023ED